METRQEQVGDEHYTIILGIHHSKVSTLQQVPHLLARDRNGLPDLSLVNTCAHNRTNGYTYQYGYVMMHFLA